MPLDGTLWVDLDDVHRAAEVMVRAAERVEASGTGLLIGTHDTHARSLDAALDEFRDRAGHQLTLLETRTQLLALLLTIAGDRMSGLETALARALGS